MLEEKDEVVFDESLNAFRGKDFVQQIASDVEAEVVSESSYSYCSDGCALVTSSEEGEK